MVSSQAQGRVVPRLGGLLGESDIHHRHRRRGENSAAAAAAAAAAARSSSSLYPLHPQGSRVLLRVPPEEVTVSDRILVVASSLFIFGSVAWVPALLRWLWKRWRPRRRTEQGQQRQEGEKRAADALYGALFLSCLALLVCGPHRSPRIGATWLKFRHWGLWKAWMRFVAMEVIADQQRSRSRSQPTESDSGSHHYRSKEGDEILAFVPHGIIPFSMGFAALPELAKTAFGSFRLVVAPAVRLFPVLGDLVSWLDPVDATRSRVDEALSAGHRLGIVPGGIAEIFAGYPRAGTDSDTEYCIVRRGLFRMAARHRRPVVPVYCFGATKMMRRLEIPILERLSLWLRVSICIFYGVWGLPVPFRQRLSYVVGRPVVPPPAGTAAANAPRVGGVDAAADEMYTRFCEELLRIFERHKEAYGWGHKSLQLVER